MRGGSPEFVSSNGILSLLSTILGRAALLAIALRRPELERIWRGKWGVLEEPHRGFVLTAPKIALSPPTAIASRFVVGGAVAGLSRDVKA